MIGRVIRVSPEPASGLSAATASGTLPAVFATILDRMARVNRASGARPARGPLRVTLRLTLIERNNKQPKSYPIYYWVLTDGSDCRGGWDRLTGS